MFTQSWEDPDCDLSWLRPASGETILAITSGGDNVLEFLLCDPERIVTVDINPTQNYLLELKCAGFRQLHYLEMLTLLGVRTDSRASLLYDRVREALSHPARLYWDDHREWFDQGLLSSGGFEQYFALLRSVLRVAQNRRRIERLFTLDPGEQRVFYEREWTNWRWRALIRIGCSKKVLSRRLDPSWFEHSNDFQSFGAHFEGLVEHVIAEIPTRSNYFLAQILLGRYVDETEVPRYLQRSNFDTIRNRLNRLNPVTSDIGEALAALPSRSVDTFALSNVFEYSPLDLFARSCSEIRRVARPGARIVLRNLLAPRILAEDPAFHVDLEESDRLRRADRGFIYSWFEAARVRGDKP